MMTSNVLVFVICIAIDVCVVCEANFIHSEDRSVNFDALISPNRQTSIQIGKESRLWQEYEFESGIVNREELRITDIQIWQDLKFQQITTNWQYIKHGHESYIAGTENSTLFLYHFDVQKNLVTSRANLSIAETIKSFKIISFSSNDEKTTEIKDSIVVILSIENSNSIQYLKWFYLRNHQFYPFWIWELLKAVKSLKYFNFNDKHKLLILYEKSLYFNQSYSLVEVYEINTSRQFSKQLCCQFLVNEISDIRICPSREGSKTFALIDKNYVTLHEYKDIFSKCALKSVKDIKVSNVNNVICFESSNINHLAVSGLPTNFFKFRPNQLMYEKEAETLLNEVGDVHFITYLSVDTYRNDVVLLLQLKNLTILALCWQNENFQLLRFPNNKLNDFDLSKVTVIPNYGFFNGSRFVELKVELVQLQKPEKSGIETLLRKKSILENILNTQELRISEIEAEMHSSHLNDSQIENDLKIQNLIVSNSAQIDVDHLSVNEINNIMISMESNNFTLEKLQINYEESRTLLSELEAEINQIEDEVEKTVSISSVDISFLEEIDVAGNFEIGGSTTVKNLFAEHLNNINVDLLIKNWLTPDKKIIGNKTFPSINFLEGNLKIKCLNGVPIENFQFEEDDIHYTDIDFTKIKKIEVKDNLNFSKVNNINWNILMDQLVLKNEKKVIPGRTQFLGIMNTSFIRTNYLNDFKYPAEYIVTSGPGYGEVAGVKTFKTLTVSELQDVKTINNIDADEFIILNADQNLEERIIFENLVIEESLQIDGKVVGLPEQYINPDLTLLNSNIVQSNAMFKNLYVSGKVYVENLIDGIEWSEIDDLILRTDESVIVTGTKVFPNNVQILGNLEIKTSIINGHHVNSFITLDSRQIMPNLSKISGNIQFTGVTYEELENLEDKLRINLDEMGGPKCLTKPFVFLKAPIVDEFSSSFINNNITGSDFSAKLENLLSDINFVNLKCKKLMVKKLEPLTVNSIDIKELEDKKITRSTYQELSGMIKINNFEVNNFYATFINNRSYEELQNTVREINSFYKEFLDNERSIYLLNTNKFITTPNINGKNLRDFLDINEIAELLLRTNASIENLIVKGLVNNLNFTKNFSDCVLKNEEFITIKGPKKINRFTAHNLKVQYINGHSVQDIMTDTRNQTLLGPVIIKGSAYVSQNFNSQGNINDFNYRNIYVDIEKVNDTTYKLTGDFLIDDFTSINNLMVAGRIQEKDIITFLDNLIYLNDTNVVISSVKVFDGTVQFNDYITASKSLNNVELESFYKNAISINNSTLVNSAIIFDNDVILEKDLVVVDSLKCNTIKGINIENMMENAIYFNRPTSIMESVTLSNVIFNSDVTVEFWNNTDIDKLLVLNKDEVIEDSFKCVNVHVENLTIRGLLNGENLTKIYGNTFMISADQHINGKMSFLNNIYIHGDLASRYMNDIDVTKIISLEASDPMEGNFVFDSPVVVNNNVTVLQYLNNINISQWQCNTIIKSSPTKNIIYGNWTIYSNSDFKENVRGSGFINDVSMDSLSYTVQRENEEIQKLISNGTKNIQTICKNLQERKNQTDYLLHKFKSFEYFRVLQFDTNVESAHHFEFNGADYILINFEICRVDIYAYTDEVFLLFANASDFGSVKQYVHFNYKENLYLVTAGKVQCGRNSGNLWMIQNEQVKHIYDLGNVTSIKKLSELNFVVIADHQIQKWSIEDVHQNLFEPMHVQPIKHSNIKFLSQGTDILLASYDVIYRFQNETFELNEIENPFKSTDISSFRAGIHQNEYILLHDEEINSDHFFIYDQDLFQPKELQSIHALKPNSFTIINFDGLYETLLVFAENKRAIQIYEYKGIEYFKFHSSIQMKVEKLYSFQLRTHSYFVKRQCIAVVQGFKLTILEAKMYGEKLDANNQLICSTV